MRSEPSSDDYQVGRGLLPDAPTYVKRQADEDLYKGLKAGEFCYVLNSLHMGKTSLLVRTLHRLQAEGAACAAVNLAEIGSEDVSADQWYVGVARSLVNGFDLSEKVNLRTWWLNRDFLSPVQRFSEFIEVLLALLTQNIVIFIDEIDQVLNLDFSADDFFSVVWACYDNRAQKPAYKRLTFALFGVATPADLTKDRNRSPFNMGRAIALRGFQLQEAQPLAAGLIGTRQGVLQVILAWTGGQPLLTQKLCKLALSSMPAAGEAQWVESLVRSRVLTTWELQDQPAYLRTIRDRLLANPQLTERILRLYRQILQRGEVIGNNSREQKELLLSGLVVENQGTLSVSHPIAAAVFSASWVDQVLASFAQPTANYSLSSQPLPAEPARTGLTPAQSLQQEDQSSYATRGWGNRLGVPTVQSGEAVNQAFPRTRQWTKWIVLGLAGLAVGSAIATLATLLVQQRLQEANSRGMDPANTTKQPDRQRAEIGQNIPKTNQQAKAAEQTAEKAQQQIKPQTPASSQTGTLSLGAARLPVGPVPPPILLVQPPAPSRVQMPRRGQAQQARAPHRVTLPTQVQEQVQGPASIAAARQETQQSTKVQQAADAPDVLPLPVLESQPAVHQEPQGHRQTKQAVEPLSEAPPPQAPAQARRSAILPKAVQVPRLKQVQKTKQQVRNPRPAATPSAPVRAPGKQSASSGVAWRLEQAGIRALQQFQFAEIEALLAAMQSGEELQALVSDGRPLQDYPAVSPLLALQTILDNIHERNQFSGHQAAVSGLAFSPDGQQIATAGSNGTIRLWNRSGQLLAQVNGHQGAANSLAFSPDGRQIASAGSDGMIRLWNRSGQLLAQVNGHQSPVTSMDFSPSGQQIATAGGNGVVRLWNCSGQLLAETKAHQGAVSSLGFSPDGQQIATAGVDSALRLWDRSGNLIAQAASGQGKISSLDFSPNGQQIVTGGENGTVRLWNRAGRLLAQVKGHQGPVYGVGFSPDGQRLATAGSNGTVRLWNRAGQLLAQVKGHQGRLSTMSFSPDGQFIATAGADGTVQMWSLPSQPEAYIDSHPGTVNTMSFSPDGQLIATAGADGTVCLWQRSGQLLAQVKTYQGAVQGISFSPDGKQLATAGSNDTVRFWSRSGQLLTEVKTQQGKVHGVSYSPNGQFIATAGSNDTIRLWNRSRQLVAEVKTQQGGVEDVSFSPDGQFIATAGSNDTVRVWNRSGQLLAQVDARQGKVHGVSHSPDGQRLATAGENGTLRLWSRSGQLLAQVKTQQGRVEDADFSPDGQHVATAGIDGTVRLWPVYDLDELLARGCDWLRDYLATHPDAPKVCPGQGV